MWRMAVGAVTGAQHTVCPKVGDDRTEHGTGRWGGVRILGKEDVVEFADHLSRPEQAEIAPLRLGRALRLPPCELCKDRIQPLGILLDSLAELAHDLDNLIKVILALLQDVRCAHSLVVLLELLVGECFREAVKEAHGDASVASSPRMHRLHHAPGSRCRKMVHRKCERKPEAARRLHALRPAPERDSTVVA